MLSFSALLNFSVSYAASSAFGKHANFEVLCETL